MPGATSAIPIEIGLFHPDRHTIEGPDGVVRLSPLEARLLLFLARHPGRTFTQAELLRDVWGYDARVTSKTVYATVGRLRVRMERDPDAPRHLITDAGAGYRFEPLAPALVAAAAPAAEGRTGFIGRQAELAQIAERIAGHGGALALIGAGGMGKTRLARRVAELAGAASFVDLSECRGVATMARLVALALGADLVGDSPSAQVATLLAGRGRCLLVLDNLEQLPSDATGAIEDWLRVAPEAVVIYTSRRRLGIAGEQVVIVGPLTENDAVDLFHLRARGRGRVLEPDHADDVRQLVRALDAIPLAVELAAARAGILSPAGLLARLEERSWLLRDPAGQPSRHATMEAVIAWSWELLEPWERAAMAQLSCFVGGFTLAAAEAVLALSDWREAPPNLDVVQALVDRSLVNVAYDRLPAGDAWFSMYDTVAAYAAAALVGNGEPWSGPAAEEGAFRRHGAHYGLLYLQAFRPRSIPHADPPLMRRLSAELGNLDAAVLRARARGEGGVAARCARLAWLVYRQEGPFSAALELLGVARSVAGGDAAVEVGVAYAECLCDAGRYEAAIELAARCASDARARGLPGEEVAAELARAHALLQGPSPSAAESAGRALVERCRELGEEHLVGSALTLVGVACRSQRRNEEAVRLYEAAVAACRAVGDLRGVAMARGNVASIHRDAGRFEAAELAYREAAELHRAGGNRRRLAVVRSNLAGLYELRGETEAALDLYREALDAHRAIGNARSEVFTCFGAAFLLLALGRVHEARVMVDRGLAMLRLAPGRRLEAAMGTLDAACLVEEGQPTRATEVAERALAQSRAGGFPEVQLAALGFQGLALAVLGEAVAARAAFAEAEVLLVGANELSDIVWFACCRAEGLTALGEPDAERYLDEAAERVATLPPGSTLRRRLQRSRDRIARAALARPRGRSPTPAG